MHRPQSKSPAPRAVQAGYSLIELGVSVAIVAMLVLVALTGVQSILTANKVNQQAKNVARLASKISALYANGTAGVTQLEVVQVGGWTSQYANTSTGAVSSAWGTAEGIAPNTKEIAAIAAQSGFVYIIYGVPAEACVDLAKALSNVVYSVLPFIPNGGTTASYANLESASLTGNDSAKPAGKSFSASFAGTQCSRSSTFDFVMTIKP